MAREKMVTRTVVTTIGIAMVCDVKNASVINREFEVSGTYEYASDVLAELWKTDTNDFRTVSVISFESKETLYGMPEADFIKYSKVLPPRNTQTQQA